MPRPAWSACCCPAPATPRRTSSYGALASFHGTWDRWPAIGELLELLDPQTALAQRIALLDRPSVLAALQHAPQTLSMASIDAPARVRVVLPHDLGDGARQVLGRLVLDQFVQAAAAATTDVLKVVVCDIACERLADDLGRLRDAQAGAVMMMNNLSALPEATRDRLLTGVGSKAVLASASPDDAALARKAWADGWTAGEIAGALPPRHGIVALAGRGGEQLPPLLVDLAR